MDKASAIIYLASQHFAKLCFENDRDRGAYPEVWEFEDLPEDETATYVAEARIYIENHPFENWPTNILESFEAS